MALVLTVGGVDRTSSLVDGTLVVEQRAEGFISVCSFVLRDDGSLNISEELDVTVVDDPTTFFSGRTADVDYSSLISSTRNIIVKCQDKNAQLGETVIDSVEAFSAEADADIIDTLFDDYLPAVDSETYVETIQDPMTITLGPCTLRSALSQICTRTGAYFYIDFDNKLHYFSSEENDAAWYLSDDPDDVDSFSYFDKPTRKSQAITRLDGVYVKGDGVEGWRGSHGAGDRQAIVIDNRITTETGRDERGDAILNEYGDAKVVYTVRTYKAGLAAGMDVRFVCSLYDVDDTFTVRKMTVRWDLTYHPYYELELGDPVNPSLTRDRIWLDTLEESLGPIGSPRIPVSARGWSMDLVFSATDYNTVAWAGAGTITLADGSTYTIDAGDTGNMAADTVYYIYLDLDTSETALQTTTDASVAVGSNKLLVAVAVAVENVDSNKATFKTFGGEGVGVMITADNIVAETITGNEIAANAIDTGHITAGAVQTDQLDALAVTAAKIAANTITADKLTIGGTMFNVDDGLLLLGPANRIETDTWYGTRSERASISGAFHQDQGRWQFSRGLVVERTTTNYVENPSFEVNTNNWAEAGFGCTIERATGESVFGAACAEVTWGAGGGTYVRTGTTDAGTFAQGDEVTVSIYAKLISGDPELNLGIFERDAGDSQLSGQFETITISSRWARYSATFTLEEADVDRLRIYVGEANDAASNFYIDGAQLEKWSWASSYCDGTLGEGYSWAGTAHASTSTRTATYVNLDEFIPLIDDNDTLTHVVRARMPWDYDFTPSEAGWLTPFLFTYRDDGTNDQVLLYYSITDDKFKVNINANALASLESSAQTFSEGDEILFVVTLDFDANDFNLYIDGVLEDNATGAETAPADIDHWNLGSEEDDGVFPGNFGGVISEYAVLDGVMTAAEVGNLYNLQRPITDLGAHNAPGIYVLDGKFAVASSTTGARVHVDADGIKGYNSSEKTFELNSDGSGQIGADSYEPITWDTTGLIEKLKAIQMNIGQPIIDSDSCLMLLSPFSIKSKTEWKASRGASATISGAFHTEQGYWDGSRALTVEEATTNYELAPRMLDDDSSGFADGWGYWDNFGSGGSATLTVGAHPITERGWLQRVQYTGAAGDVNDQALVTDLTSVGSFAQGDDVTISVDLKGDWSGCNVRLWIREQGGAATTHNGPALTPSWTPKRVSFTATMVDAGCTHVFSGIHIYNVDNGDEVDIYFGAVNIEKADHPTSFCCGALDWCDWSGAADASTSTRTATEVNLDDYVSLLSDQDQLSFIIWAQMPYDHDADWPSATFNYLFDTRKAAGAQFLLLGYNPTAEEFQFHNGALIENGPTEDFSAGDWKLFILTVDFDADEYYLYVDGELGAYSTDAQATGTVTDWTLGCIYNGSAQGNFNVGYHAALDRVLTEDEVWRIWNLAQAPVDMGAMDKPGIYILDGRFRIASSASGNRIDITADEIAGYDSSDTKQFYIQASNGVGYFGGGDCKLDEDGVSFLGGSGDVNQIKWYDDTFGGDLIGWAYADWGGGGGDDAVTWVIAEVPAGGANAAVKLVAIDGGSDVRFSVDSTGVISGTAVSTFQMHDGAKYIIRYTAGNFEVDLGDAAGAKHFYVKDSGANVVLDVDSDGNLDASGSIEGPNFSVDVPGNIEGTTLILSEGSINADGDLVLSGKIDTAETIRTSSNQDWNLGGTASGTVTHDYKIHVEIGGQWYTILAAYGLL